MLSSQKPRGPVEKQHRITTFFPAEIPIARVGRSSADAKRRWVEMSQWGTLFKKGEKNKMTRNGFMYNPTKIFWRLIVVPHYLGCCTSYMVKCLTGMASSDGSMASYIPPFGDWNHVHFQRKWAIADRRERFFQPSKKLCSCMKRQTIWTTKPVKPTS